MDIGKIKIREEHTGGIREKEVDFKKGRYLWDKDTGIGVQELTISYPLTLGEVYSMTYIEEDTGYEGGTSDYLVIAKDEKVNNPDKLTTYYISEFYNNRFCRYDKDKLYMGMWEEVDVNEELQIDLLDMESRPTKSYTVIFKQKVRDLGYDILYHDLKYVDGEVVKDGISIFKQGTNKLVAEVHTKNMYEMRVYPTSYMTEELFNIITDYVKLPKEKRNK